MAVCGPAALPSSGGRLLRLLWNWEWSSLLYQGRLRQQLWVVVLLLPTRLQLCEDLSEERRLSVDPEHGAAESVDDGQATIPEPFLVLFHQKRLERIGDFIAHVGVGEVKASENNCLQLLLAAHLLTHKLSYQHVHEHHVGRVDERDVLQKDVYVSTALTSYHIQHYTTQCSAYCTFRKYDVQVDERNIVLTHKHSG